MIDNIMTNELYADKKRKAEKMVEWRSPEMHIEFQWENLREKDLWEAKAQMGGQYQDGFEGGGL